MAETGGLWIIDAEEGDTSEFTSVTQEGSNTFLADVAAKNNGSYGFKCTFDGVTDDCYGLYTDSARDEIYVRFYVYISADITFNDAWASHYICLLTNTGWTNVVRFEVGSNADKVPYRWIIQGLNLDYLVSSINFSLGAWHYIEIHWVKHATTGGAEVWIDGTKIKDDLDNNTDAAQIDKYYFGGKASSTEPDTSGDFYYIDDIKADTQYIGAYSEAGGGLSPTGVLRGPLGGPLFGPIM